MTKEKRTKEFLPWGGRVWKIKHLWAREYDVVNKENRTKEFLAWGGRVLGN